MIKFWSDNFKYTKRFGSCEPFGYLFSVCGESANYLINHYSLDYSNVFVNCYADKTIYVGSRNNNNTKGDCTDCKVEDIEELFNILLPTINTDMKNYEDYMCDDWYKKDSRWE